MYRNLTPKAPFPFSYLEWKELLFMRSWQGESMTKFLYYLMILVGVYQCINTIIILTIDLGVGGFFLGLFVGVVIMFLTFLFARLFCEALLSLFVIRDGIAANLANSNSSSNTGATLAFQSSSPSSVYPNVAPTNTVSYQQGALPNQQPYESL